MNLDFRKDRFWNGGAHWQKPIRMLLQWSSERRWEPGLRSRLWGMDRGGCLKSKRNDLEQRFFIMDPSQLKLMNPLSE